ncbi:MAG: N-acetylglucosamine-6-phosphate deacetylase [Acidobacteria bacterium]|nr:MAG: N-acetylglucosamine-6-phosphate deacetylase [Acidobacteriota bacterium]
MKTCITAARLFTPIEVIENPVVVIEDGTIQSLGPQSSLEVPAGTQQADFPDLVIAPGFIDIHVHGGAGHDVMRDDPSGRVAFEKAMARHGVTSYLPTTVTAPMDRILGAVDRLGNVISAEEMEHAHVGARPLGIHLEGPFISPAKCGVHPREFLIAPTLDLFEKILEASGGTLKMMTIAPELAGAPEVIRHARERGVYASIGHSNATFEEAGKGIVAGAISATHTFNAMRALDHREPGILGAVLSDDHLMADIIADGVHVAPAIIEVFLKAKGVDRAVLITDAISATGMPDGTYQLGPFEVQVHGDRCEFQGKLAGSVLTLDRAVRNVMSFAGWTLQQSATLATRNPARLIGAEGKGELAIGNDADLVLLSAKGEVVHTMVGGRFARE